MAKRNRKSAQRRKAALLDDTRIPKHAYNGPRQEPRAFGEATRERDQRTSLATANDGVDYHVIPGTPEFQSPKHNSGGGIYNVNGVNAAAPSAPFNRPLCMHRGTQTILQTKNRDGDSALLSIAAARHLTIADDSSLIVMCLDERLDDTQIDVPQGYESLRDHVEMLPPQIVIPWDDMSTPNLMPSFWIELDRLLPAGRTTFVCFGGHGRSGTALACVIVAHFKCSARYAINLVRQRHCDQAIETWRQEKYIERVAEFVLAGKAPADDDVLPQILV